MRSSQLFGSMPLLVALLLTPACSGKSGDICQVNGDCGSGLICCKSNATETITQRGTCEDACMFVAPDAAVGGDATTSADASLLDADTQDALMSEDSATPPDAPAAEPDAALSEDAASAPDA